MAVKLSKKHETHARRLLKEDEGRIYRPIEKTRELATIMYQYYDKIDTKSFPVGSESFNKILERKIGKCARCRAFVWKWFKNYFIAQKVKNDKKTAKPSK